MLNWQSLGCFLYQMWWAGGWNFVRNAHETAVECIAGATGPAVGGGRAVIAKDGRMAGAHLMTMNEKSVWTVPAKAPFCLLFSSLLFSSCTSLWRSANTSCLRWLPSSLFCLSFLALQVRSQDCLAIWNSQVLGWSIKIGSWSWIRSLVLRLRHLCCSTLTPSDIQVSASRELRRAVFVSLTSMAKEHVDVLEWFSDLFRPTLAPSDAQASIFHELRRVVLNILVFVGKEQMAFLRFSELSFISKVAWTLASLELRQVGVETSKLVVRE